MASLRMVNKLLLRGLLTISVFLVFYNEILIYYVNRISWQHIECQLTNCTRVLFVADPQLLGNSFDTNFYSGIARWDSDRYVRKTFEHSLAFGQPHIICFLGDLLDEGSVATPDDFQSYVERFRSIYTVPENVQLLHVPGDNDIGGENGEYISNSNLKRFESDFMAQDLFDYKNSLRFFKINRMTFEYTNPDPLNNAQRIRIGVSHAPILIGGGPLLRNIINDLDPHIIFSAHWHESKIFIHPSTKSFNFYENAIKEIDLKALKEQEHSYIEIMVPTASYRMGTLSIGLGFGVLENYKLRYTVLWQPKRFICLFFYVFWILFVLCALFVYKMMTRCPFRVAKRSQATYSRIPQF